MNQIHTYKISVITHMEEENLDRDEMKDCILHNLSHSTHVDVVDIAWLGTITNSKNSFKMEGYK